MPKCDWTDCKLGATHSVENAMEGLNFTCELHTKSVIVLRWGVTKPLPDYVAKMTK